jgi:hypothetical protein
MPFNHDDLGKGEIYIIENEENGKCYIGQAKKYVSSNNNKWGTEGRWKSHLREAFNIQGKDHCRLLNCAIRKYGADSFKVSKLHDCNLEDMDKLEEEMIEEYNSCAPFGYNLRRSQKDGRDHHHYRAKYMGHKLNEMFFWIRIEQEGQDITYKRLQLKDITISKGQWSRTLASASVDNRFIEPIIDKCNVYGYIVNGMMSWNSREIPYKVFNKNSTRWNLDQAKKYLDQIMLLNENKVNVSDWSLVETIHKRNKKGVEKEVLPKYVNLVFYKGAHSGYIINGYPVPKGDGTFKKSRTNFTNSKYTMEERYDMALQYLQQLQNTYPINDT